MPFEENKKDGSLRFVNVKELLRFSERSTNKYIFISATACRGGRATQLMGFLSTFRWLITDDDNRHKEATKSRLQLGELRETRLRFI